MRFEWRPFFAAFLGAGALMVAYAIEAARGTEVQVRLGWIAIVPQVLLGITIAALGLSVQRPSGWGTDLANFAITGLCTHLFMVIQLPLASSEVAGAQVWASLDIIGWALPGILLLLLIQLPMPNERRRVVLGAMALVALVMVGRVGFELVREPTVFRGAGAFLGVLSCVAALRIASPLVPRRAR